MKKGEPLYQQVYNSIVKQIELGLLRNGDRVPSERELSEQHHVSQITAKNALNNLAENGYVERVQGKGTFVKHSEPSHNRGLILGTIFTTMNTDIDKELLNHLELYSQQLKMRFFFGLSRESVSEEINLIKRFISYGVEGLIIFPTESENYNTLILQLHLEHFPMVLIDRCFLGLSIPSVVSDNFDGGYQLANIALDKGYHNIAYIETKEENSATLERRAGIEQAFIDHDVPINKNLWMMVDSQSDSKHSIVEFLDEREVDCIITINSFFSNLLCDYIKEKKIFHLTFDKSKHCDYYVKQHTDKIALEALKMLKQFVEQNKVDSYIKKIPVHIKEFR